MKTKRTNISSIGMLTACLLTLVSPVLAQETGKPKSEEPTIRLQLIVKAAKVCAGSFVPLELTVSNVGTEPIRIGRLEVLRKFTIKHLRSDGVESEGFLGFAPGTVEVRDRMARQHFDLKPDTGHRITFPLPQDQRAFPGPGKYSIRTYDIRDVMSNEAKVEIIDCSQQ